MRRTRINLKDYIETRLFKDRPHLKGRTIPVATLAHCAYQQGWSIPRIAETFTLTHTQVLAALLYYEEHRHLIDTLQTQKVNNP